MPELFKKIIGEDLKTSPETITHWVKLGEERFSRKTLGPDFETAVRLWAAHNIFMMQQNKTSETFGQYSASYPGPGEAGSSPYSQSLRNILSRHVVSFLVI